MITKNFVAAQLARLSALDFFPTKQPAALNELREACASALDEPVLKRVIDDWLHDQEQCPKPAEMYRLIFEQNERAKPAPVCPRCGGNGMYGGHMGGIYGKWRFCTCVAGRALECAEPEVCNERNHLNEIAGATQP